MLKKGVPDPRVRAAIGSPTQAIDATAVIAGTQDAAPLDSRRGGLRPAGPRQRPVPAGCCRRRQAMAAPSSLLYGLARRPGRRRSTAGATLTIVGIYRAPVVLTDYWFGREPAYFPMEFPAGHRREGGGGSLRRAVHRAADLPAGDRAPAGLGHPRLPGDPWPGDGGHRARPWRTTSTGITNSTDLQAFGAVVRTSLPGLVLDIQKSWTFLAVPVLLATVQLLALIWLLLFLVVTDTVEARSSEIALAKLRGYRGPQAARLRPRRAGVTCWSRHCPPVFSLGLGAQHLVQPLAAAPRHARRAAGLGLGRSRTGHPGRHGGRGRGGPASADPADRRAVAQGRPPGDRPRLGVRLDRPDRRGRRTGPAQGRRRFHVGTAELGRPAGPGPARARGGRGLLAAAATGVPPAVPQDRLAREHPRLPRRPVHRPATRRRPYDDDPGDRLCPGDLRHRGLGQQRRQPHSARPDADRSAGRHRRRADQRPPTLPQWSTSSTRLAPGRRPSTPTSTRPAATSWCWESSPTGFPGSPTGAHVSPAPAWPTSPPS